MSNAVLEAIRTRRMVRALADAPVPREQVEQILESGGGGGPAGPPPPPHPAGRPPPVTLRLLRMVSPGMFQRPRAVIAICIDGQRARSFGMSPTARGLYVDVGTAAQTMLLAAHSIGLGAGVVTSFSRAAVSVVLNLPAGFSPEMFICLGFPAARQPPAIRPRTPVTWQSLSHWERFP